MKFPLDQIEARLQNLIEGSLESLLPWGGRHNPLAGQLVQAIRSSVRIEDGIRKVPANFVFLVATPQLPFWQAHPAELEGLSQLLYQSGREAGYRFDGPPQILLAEDPALADGQTRIVAQPEEETGKTAVLEVEHQESSVDEIPQNAILIVNGIRIVPLHQRVINIGRREENHLVTDDPRVSRTHAQIRAVHGVFYLFDLNSTGGTFVNGERITRTALKPGDVISLAGYPIIYSQDTLTDKPASSSPGSSMASGSTDELRTNPEDST